MERLCDVIYGRMFSDQQFRDLVDQVFRYGPHRLRNGRKINWSLLLSLMGQNRVVPVAVKLSSLESNGRQLFIRHFDLRGITACVQLGIDV